MSLLAFLLVSNDIWHSCDDRDRMGLLVLVSLPIFCPLVVVVYDEVSLVRPLIDK